MGKKMIRLTWTGFFKNFLRVFIRRLFLMISVLIVEDDPMVAKFNKYYLEQVGGFSLKGVASSAEEAFKVLHKEKIDLILLDIYMPGIDGLQLLAELRKMDKSIDVIVISAARDSLSIKKAIQYGAADYLIKPFEFQRFSSALCAYRDREKFIKNQELLSQEDLDNHFLNKEQGSNLIEFPKGLAKDTLKLVWDAILQMDETVFSTEEIAEVLGISRVSIRKYLNFLEEIGSIKKEVIYGSLGRPTYKYKRVKSNDSVIKDYIL
jgi:two-component system, CitB family, response regulator MalR